MTALAITMPDFFENWNNHKHFLLLGFDILVCLNL